MLWVDKLFTDGTMYLLLWTKGLVLFPCFCLLDTSCLLTYFREFPPPYSLITSCSLIRYYIVFVQELFLLWDISSLRYIFFRDFFFKRILPDISARDFFQRYYLFERCLIFEIFHPWEISSLQDFSIRDFFFERFLLQEI